MPNEPESVSVTMAADSPREALRTNVLLRAIGLSRPDAHLLCLGALAGLVYGAVYPVIGLVYAFLVSSLGGPPDDIMSKGMYEVVILPNMRNTTIFGILSVVSTAGALSVVVRIYYYQSYY